MLGPATKHGMCIGGSILLAADCDVSGRRQSGRPLE